jgi:hypothetical protein
LTPYIASTTQHISLLPLPETLPTATVFCHCHHWTPSTTTSASITIVLNPATAVMIFTITFVASTNTVCLHKAPFIAIFAA